MANEASVQELQELESILRSNPELHFSLQTLSDLWQVVPAEDVSELEAAYATHLERMNLDSNDVPGNIDDDYSDHAVVVVGPRRRRFFNRRNLIAASIIAFAAVTGWVYTTVKSTPPVAHAIARETSEISTKNGSKTNIVLPDGSKVWLNAGSKITYDKVFGEQLREVTLTGEAYFDVVHNAERPFIIHTRAMDIKVLGTEFNVKSYPGEKTTETSLIRGSIEVTLRDKRAERIILKPNEKLVVSNEIPEEKTATPKKARMLKHTPIINLGTLNYFSLDSTVLETSWVNNRLIFEDESFEEIALKMSRWYGVNFLFNDEQVKNLRFTGNFRNETVWEALTAMQITADFNFEIVDKNVTITKR